MKYDETLKLEQVAIIHIKKKYFAFVHPHSCTALKYRQKQGL